MLQHEPFSEISGADAGWLKAKHHFAIGPHGNPAHKAIGISSFSMTMRLHPTQVLACIITRMSRSSAISGRVS